MTQTILIVLCCVSGYNRDIKKDGVTSVCLPWIDVTDMEVLYEKSKSKNNLEQKRGKKEKKLKTKPRTFLPRGGMT